MKNLMLYNKDKDKDKDKYFEKEEVAVAVGLEIPYWKEIRNKKQNVKYDFLIEAYSFW